ncbi:hypothetical protein BGZ76_009874 [Entomortierella beljakovae]|nr:hypothetical protein BGZ76_009874 [Entomortierella beljakovae]
MKPPFDKTSRVKVPERWLAVVDVLKQGGERGGQGTKEYENVTYRTCMLAWNKFREEHMSRVNAQAKITGAVENQDAWTNLVRTVFALEEAEKGKKKSASGSKKTSPELREQPNQQGASLVAAAVSGMKRQRPPTTSTGISDASASASESETTRRRSRPRNNYQQDTQKFQKLILDLQRKLDQSSADQRNRVELLLRAISNMEERTERQVASISTVLGLSSERQTAELARVVTTAISSSAQINADAVKSAADRQAVVADRQAAALEALASALLKGRE